MRGVDLNRHRDDGAQLLAAAAKARREDLGLGQKDLQGYQGPSHDRVWAIENAHQDRYDRSTLQKLEQALQWEPGSVDRVLKGEEPIVKPGTERRREPEASSEDPEGRPPLRTVSPPEPVIEEHVQLVQRFLGGLASTYGRPTLMEAFSRWLQDSGDDDGGEPSPRQLADGGT